MKRDCVNISGVMVDRLKSADVVKRIEEFISEGGRHQVAYANAECINRSIFDKRYKSILDEADLVYADGIGVVWASKFSEKPIPERASLGDFLPDLLRLCVRNRYKIFLLGWQKGVADEAAANLKRDFPALDIAGTYHGYFGPDEDDKVCGLINNSKPHILLVGMGVPKQEKWIKNNISKLDVPVLWGVGALLDYYALRVKRAPVFMRRAGLEWLFRLINEPARLWKRYIIGNVFFILHAFSLLILDALLLAAAWIGAYWLRYAMNGIFQKGINDFYPYLAALPFIITLWMAISMYFGLYKPSRGASGVDEQASILKAAIMGLLITMAFSFLFKEFELGRAVVIISGLLSILSLGISRALSRYIDKNVLKKSALPVRAAIVGCGELAETVRRELEDSPDGYNFIGYISEGEAGREGCSGKEALGCLKDLDALVSKHNIDEIYLVSEGEGIYDKLDLVEDKSRLPVKFRIVSRHLKDFSDKISLKLIDGVPLLDFERNEPSKAYDIFKAFSDIVLASACIILALPMLFIVSLAVKADSRGPAFFRHERLGKGAKPFRMYKFRTMREGVSEYELAPNKIDDPRVTRVGRVLRRLSIDEIPQLFNVLKGDMGIIGPRPEMAFIVKDYMPWQRRRLDIKPGITGLWQVVGRKELTLHKNIEYDIYYVNHRSVILDLVILIRTVPAVILRKGAF